MKCHLIVPLLVATAIAMGAQEPTNCPDRAVRPDSPCITSALGCSNVGGNCPGQGDIVYDGPFQCDLVVTGVYCRGDGASLKDCYFRGTCKDVDDGPSVNCQVDIQQGQLHVKEGLKTDPCPESPPSGGQAG